MKKILTILLSAVMVVMLACAAFGMVTSAGSSTITYEFSGSHMSDKGFAEGTVTISAGAADGGTYRLYWAGDSAALEGFDPIAVLSVPASGSESVTFEPQTVIPAQATKLIAFKGVNAPADLRVSKAAAVYTLPSDKILGKSRSDLLYSFASYSDLHIKSDSEQLFTGYENRYPYDEEHLKAALRTAAQRNVDFIVTTGDHVNNQRNDPNGGNNNLYAEEWNTYLRIVADSEYTGPIYEAIGNHELWNYDIESDYKNKDWRTGYNYFIQATGLNSTKEAYNSGKGYYEITEPVTGDHFLFMALEGGFYTDRTEEFSIAQLNWLENKLKAYNNDGKNVFILEHANFENWGSGDIIGHPVYDLPLKDTNSATLRLKNILKKYKNAVIITGHTHFRFDLQLNYSDNNGVSAPMIHNSSVGAVRDILSGYTRYDDSSEELTEGYIVEVYDDATIFYGTNLWNNSINPGSSYIIAQSTYANETPTEAPTKPVEPTEKPTEPVDFIWGDADRDGELSILDATTIQRYLVGLPVESYNERAADVDADGDDSILDATSIQRKLAGIIKLFIAEGGEPETRATLPLAAGAELEPPSSNFSILRTQTRSVLDKYWLLASYDQYQALKRAYRENVGLDELTNAYNDFSAAVKAFWPGDTVDVYFTNTPDWDNVYAYPYNGDGEYQTAWPGKMCTYVTTNDLGQDIYKVTVPIGRYNFIIFDNGDPDNPQQTVNLALGVTRNQGYYTEGRYYGKYKGRQYKYQ